MPGVFERLREDVVYRKGAKTLYVFAPLRDKTHKSEIQTILASKLKSLQKAFSSRLYSP
jgi:hypothetical protein